MDKRRRDPMCIYDHIEYDVDVCWYMWYACRDVFAIYPYTSLMSRLEEATSRERLRGPSAHVSRRFAARFEPF